MTFNNKIINNIDLFYFENFSLTNIYYNNK